ncbi:MAG: cache domain-containing protein [Pseudomonadota bacterium]
MKLLFKVVLIFIATMLVASSMAADNRATPEEAREMLKKAVAYLKAHGKEKAFVKFSNKQGEFVDRDLYLTVYDFKGKTVAHGINPRMVGKDNIMLQDANGKLLIKERIEIATAKGGGIQEYKFFNPVSKEIEQKVMFFEVVGDVIVACGAYKPN